MSETPIGLNNDIIPESVENAITNLTDKPTKNIGTTFGDLWYLVFGGISFQADKKRIKYKVELQKFEKECRKEIDNIPEEKRVEPDTQTVAMALEASKYCVENERVREMFANLIASTMNSDMADYAHPSFPEIIKQMSPLDAKIFMLFTLSHEYPICEYWKMSSNGDYKKICTNVFLEVSNKSDAQTIEKVAVSISALVRSGLLFIDYDSLLAEKSVYDNFRQTELYIDNFNKLPNNKSLEVKKGIVRLTPLGKQLLTVCCPKEMNKKFSSKFFA